MKGIRALLCMMIGLVIGSIVGITVVNISHKKEKRNVTTEVTAAPTTEMALATETDPATQTDIAPATVMDADTEEEILEVSDAEQPQVLTDILKESLVGYDALAKVGCRQLITVKANQNEADIAMYTCNDQGKWTDAGLTTTGYVGQNGVSRESYEGSRMTPAGAFPIGEAFYIEEKPETGLSMFQITENTYWVEDSESELYNQRVELSGEKTWQSAEHMIEYTSAYKYGFVVNFNMNPVEPGRGSAIFFHVGNQPTLGCIAAPEEMVLAYLAKLDETLHPYIVIQ